MRAIVRILLLCGVAGFACATQLPDANELMQRIDAQDRGRNLSAEGRLTLFDAQGHSQTRSFRYRRRSDGADIRELLVFATPLELAGVALLSVRRAGDTNSGRQYIYIPATRRVREVVNAQRSARFVGSDFTFEDLERGDLDAFSYRAVGAGETIDGHSTIEVEALPRAAGVSQYARRLLWIARDVPVVLRERLFGADGSLVRERRNDHLHREGGIWGPRQSEMRTPQDGTRTVLILDRVDFPPLPPADDFTPEALERGASPAARAP